MKKIKKIIYKRKGKEPMEIYPRNLTKLSKKTLINLAEFGDSFAENIESFKVDENFDQSLRDKRVAFYEDIFRTLSEQGVKQPKDLFQREDVKKFIESGSESSFEERILIAKHFFFQNVFFTAETPTDLRKEIDLMMKALEEVHKSLPERKRGRKRDDLLYEMVERVDSNELNNFEAFKEYRKRQGYVSDSYIAFRSEAPAFYKRMSKARYDQTRAERKKSKKS